MIRRSLIITGAALLLVSQVEANNCAKIKRIEAQTEKQLAAVEIKLASTRKPTRSEIRDAIRLGLTPPTFNAEAAVRLKRQRDKLKSILRATNRAYGTYACR